MKETKVYVDELPTQCLDCRFAYDGRCQAKENGESYCVENCRRSDCPLIDIKTHDRELVRQVCEKIKEQLGFIVDGQEIIVCDGSATGDKTILAVLNQIQKEFEK